MASVPLVFIDTETTGLRRPWQSNPRQIWELALIRREPFHEAGEEFTVVYHVLRDELDLTCADPFALKLSGLYERHPQFDRPARVTEHGVSSYRLGEGRRDQEVFVVDNEELANEVWKHTAGAHLIGAVPSFDEESLAHLLDDHGLSPRWHYHLVDVENLAAGVLGLEPPYDSDVLFELMGAEVDEVERHTALGDARSVMALYDRIIQYRAPNEVREPVDPLLEEP